MSIPIFPNRSLGLESFQIKNTNDITIFYKIETILENISEDEVKNVNNILITKYEDVSIFVHSYSSHGIEVYFSYSIYLHPSTNNIIIESQLIERNDFESYLMYKNIFNYVKKMMKKIYGEKNIISTRLTSFFS